MTPSHTRRRGKRLRYYVSNRLISGGADAGGWRLPADAFEAAVVQAIAEHLASAARRHDVLTAVEAVSAASASDAIKALSDQVRSGGASAAAALIIAGEIGGGRMRLDLDRAALAVASGLPAGDLSDAVLAIDCAFSCRRRGVEMRIVAGDLAPRPDPTLIHGLRHAHRWSAALRSGTPLGKLAAGEGFSERYIARVIPLAGLSPRIQEAMLQGLQPVDLTLERLLRSKLPLDWSEQEPMFGLRDRHLP